MTPTALKRLTFVAIAVTLVSLACVGCSSVGKSGGSESKAGALMTLDINGVQVNFHWAPAGTFLMGSPGWEREREDCEKRHRVTLTRGFWIAETETTQELWQAVCDTNPSHFTDSPQLPVESVT